MISIKKISRSIVTFSLLLLVGTILPATLSQKLILAFSNTQKIRSQKEFTNAPLRVKTINKVLLALEGNKIDCRQTLLPPSTKPSNPKEFRHDVINIIKSWNESLAKAKKPTKKTIHVISTAALIDHHFELRKIQYIYSIMLLKSFGYEPHIVESCKECGPTFLDKRCARVFYAHTNDSTLKNKGINEAQSLRAFFENANFDDNDMIIKLTGRYHFENDLFLKFVEGNPHIDAIVKGWEELDPNPHIALFTGCFALRYKYFKDMLTSFDYKKMEDKMIDVEREVANYINKMIEQGACVTYIDRFNISAHIFYDGLRTVKIFHF